jgi:rhodanese-related sulfurtransferase
MWSAPAGDALDSPRRGGVYAPAGVSSSLAGDGQDGGPGIDRVLAQARARLARVGALEAARLMAAGALLVDTRPLEQRRRDGEVPGALVIDRNVLEWRLDPACPSHVEEVTGYDHPIVVMCNEGYSSSLAAACLLEVGLACVTDLEGGFQAWAAAGLPVARVR